MKREAAVIASIVLVALLAGTLLNSVVFGKGNPVLDGILKAIQTIESRLHSLNATATEQQQKISELQAKLDSLNNTLTARIEALELNQLALAERITALENQHKPPEEVTILYDTFDAGLDGWSYWGDPGYTLTWVSQAVKISGDGYVVDCGMQKVIDLTEWDETGTLTLSFDWRATSDYSGSAGTTGAILWIQDADSGTSRIWESLLEGGTTDTGWRHYVDDISPYVIGHPRIRIILYIHDGWIVDWHQTNSYDNIKLTTLTSP